MSFWDAHGTNKIVVSGGDRVLGHLTDTDIHHIVRDTLYRHPEWLLHSWRPPSLPCEENQAYLQTTLESKTLLPRASVWAS